MQKIITTIIHLLHSAMAWTSSVWTTSAYHSKHCTDRYQDTREDQVDQERTGGA